MLSLYPPPLQLGPADFVPLSADQERNPFSRAQLQFAAHRPDAPNNPHNTAQTPHYYSYFPTHFSDNGDCDESISAAAKAAHIVATAAATSAMMGFCASVD
jgi:hypothetical protein